MSDLRRLAGLVFVLVVAAVTLSAQPALPALTAPVNDFAKALDAESVRELERRIRALQQATGDVVVVATVPSLDGFGTIDELALRLFENGGRGIGQKGKDNGALIVLALKERQVRVEVGYDLEEFITDGYAGETIRATMVPVFRNGQYGQGLLAGATRIINRIAQRRGVELQDVPRPTQPISAPRAVQRLPGRPDRVDRHHDAVQPPATPGRALGPRALERLEQRRRAVRRWRVRRRLRRIQQRRRVRRRRWRLRRLRRRTQRRWRGERVVVKTCWSGSGLGARC